MNVVFWNLGDKLGPLKRKFVLLHKLIKEKKPDILCIAEGTTNENDCEMLVAGMLKNGYSCYYNPLMAKVESYNLMYGFKPEGLKIFIKDPSVLRVPFTFDLQKYNGRIIGLDIVLSNEIRTIIFLHNYSKNGNKQVATEQSSFISKLAEWVNLPGGITQHSVNHIIIGDFNLEPWDYVLRMSDDMFINSYFLEKHHNQAERKKKRKNSKRYYFNPLVDYVNKHPNINLAGTYHNDTYGWALFDYHLASDGCVTKYEIIISVEDVSLLDSNSSISKGFLLHGIDHLPIQISI